MNEVAEMKAKKDAMNRLDAASECVWGWTPDTSVVWLKRAIDEAEICIVALNAVNPPAMELRLSDWVRLAHLSPVSIGGLSEDVARENLIWAVDNAGLALVGYPSEIMPLDALLKKEAIQWLNKGRYTEGYCGSVLCFMIAPPMVMSLCDKAAYKLEICLPSSWAWDYPMGSVDELKDIAEQSLATWMRGVGMNLIHNCENGGVDNGR